MVGWCQVTWVTTSSGPAWIEVFVCVVGPMLLTRVGRQVGAQEKEFGLGIPFPGAINISLLGQLGQPAPLSSGARRPSAGPGRNPHLLIRSDPPPAGPRDLEAEPLVPACGVWDVTAGDPLLKGHLGTTEPDTLEGKAMGN